MWDGSGMQDALGCWMRLGQFLCIPARVGGNTQSHAIPMECVLFPVHSGWGCNEQADDAFRTCLLRSELLRFSSTGKKSRGQYKKCVMTGVTDRRNWNPGLTPKSAVVCVMARPANAPGRTNVYSRPSGKAARNRGRIFPWDRRHVNTRYGQRLPVRDWCTKGCAAPAEAIHSL